ncbi:Uncharacterised protein [Burkholderia pseudomallei]|nr:hypothetical protein DP47_3386 [Burkholderia pseudomallei Pasteur 52237]VBQ81009.1 Uncharacterised protein [Burkholderia pseudomallei]
MIRVTLTIDRARTCMPREGSPLIRVGAWVLLAPFALALAGAIGARL